MNMDSMFDNNVDDYSLSFSDELPIGTMQKLQSALCGEDSLKSYSTNVLIGNISAKKVSECVGDEFKLCGFHVKNFKYKNSERYGKYTVMFGTLSGNPCAYCSASEKIYSSIMSILYVYGDVSNWGGGIPVRIRMNTIDNGKACSLDKAYCLEIV